MKKTAKSLLCVLVLLLNNNVFTQNIINVYVTLIGIKSLSLCNYKDQTKNKF